MVAFDGSADSDSLIEADDALNSPDNTHYSARDFNHPLSNFNACTTLLLPAILSFSSFHIYFALFYLLKDNHLTNKHVSI